LIYKRRRVLTEQLAEKLGYQFTRKVLDYLYGQKLPSITSASVYRIINIYYARNNFGNGEGYIRFALCVKRKKIQEAIDRFCQFVRMIKDK
jgi:hypothetical protein